MSREIYNWSTHQGPKEPVRLPKGNIEIDNETWRDGMQGTQVIHHPTTEQKAEYLKKVAELGYSDHFDIGFPASGQKHVEEIVTLIDFSRKEKLNLTFSAAGRGAALGDVKAIAEVAQKTGDRLEADLFLDASKLRSEVEGWTRSEKIMQLRENIAFAKREDLSVMFVPERASDTKPEELFEICTVAADEGVERIAIADTRGILTPKGTANLFRAVFEKIGTKYPDIKFDFHEHDDLKMGTANCVVAAMEGVDRLHATSRGIGERAGNVALEQLLVVLDLNGIRPTDTREIQKFAKMAAEILSVPISSHEAIIGHEVTATGSGVHASTYAKDTEQSIYLPFKPERVGLETKVRIGPLSGLSNVYAYCRELGWGELTEEQAIGVLTYAKTNGGILSPSDIENVLGRNK